MRFLLCALLLGGSLAPAQTPAKKSALDKPTLEAYVRHLFVWGPQINVSIAEPKPSPMPGFLEVNVTGLAGQASQTVTFHVSKDGQKIVQGNVFDVSQNPFKSDLDKLKTEFQPSLGTPCAPVVIVLFSDFQCNFCREEGKMLRQNLINNFPKEVRLYFKDFPLEQIHPWAKPASIAGRCVFRQMPLKFWDFHDWIFDKQAEITAENLKSKLLEWAGANQVDALQLGRCIDQKATTTEVEKNAAEARALGINSTPTMFINGRRIPGQIVWPQLKQIIEFEIGYQKTAKNAGEEACCEVKLPSPLPK